MKDSQITINNSELPFVLEFKSPFDQTNFNTFFDGGFATSNCDENDTNIFFTFPQR